MLVMMAEVQEASKAKFRSHCLVLNGFFRSFRLGYLTWNVTCVESTVIIFVFTASGYQTCWKTLSNPYKQLQVLKPEIGTSCTIACDITWLLEPKQPISRQFLTYRWINFACLANHKRNNRFRPTLIMRLLWCKLPKTASTMTQSYVFCFVLGRIAVVMGQQT